MRGKMDFRKTLAKLEKEGRIAHVKSEVDPVHELAGIAKEFEGSGKALVFDRVKGREFPLAIGLWWNRDIIGSMFGVSAQEVPHYFAGAGKRFKANPVPPVVVENPPCQEVIEEDPDLTRLTVPTLALEDGGPYFSNCVVIAKDPDTGVRNTSVHRMMITGKRRITMLLDIISRSPPSLGAPIEFQTSFPGSSECMIGSFR